MNSSDGDAGVMAMAGFRARHRNRPAPSPVVFGFLPGVLDRVRSPEVSLAIWQRFTGQKAQRRENVR